LDFTTQKPQGEMMKKAIVPIITVFLFAAIAQAEEGMWLLSQIPQINLKEKGLKIDISKLYHPDSPSITSAIVRLGGGTAELVSSNGLLLTNHHVAFGAVQRASSKVRATDLITSGYLAKNPSEEIEAPGYSAYILENMSDVTHEFAEFDPLANPEQRQKAIDRKIKAMTEEIEREKSDISARVAAMYNGKQYILFVHKRFDDVRVVYVPPSAIGNYGGDIDNWMWPRHTGDFSFMRIYMAPDGTGRKFHKDNVPYKPKYWLKIARHYLTDGDLTFVIGYPGSTTRYRTSNSVDYNFNCHYPEAIKTFEDAIKLLDSFAQDSTNAKMKVAGLSKGLNNVKKNYQGRIDGLKKSHFLEKKLLFEHQLSNFLKSDTALQKQFGHILPEIKLLYQKVKATRGHDDTLDQFAWLAGNMSGVSTRLYHVAKEREKPDSERDPYFSERDIDREASRLHFKYMSYYEPADKALLVQVMRKALALPEENRIRGLDNLLAMSNQSPDEFVKHAYARTQLKNVEFVRSLYKKSSSDLEALNDPFINMAKQLYAEGELKDKRDKAFNAQITALRKQYMEALYAWKGQGMYPDANGTIRFTFGRVEGYQPRDAVYYNPFTTLRGIDEKNTDVEPFNMPEKLKSLHQEKNLGRWVHPKLNDVPVAFLHKCDITGGNSGSPVLNAWGELVGIVFDGNYEAMNSDWQYDTRLQRAISVDIRFVLFVTEKLAGADHIMKELGF
jgi:hypothetical protein